MSYVKDPAALVDELDRIADELQEAQPMIAGQLVILAHDIRKAYGPSLPRLLDVLEFACAQRQIAKSGIVLEGDYHAGQQDAFCDIEQKLGGILRPLLAADKGGSCEVCGRYVYHLTRHMNKEHADHPLTLKRPEGSDAI